VPGGSLKPGSIADITLLDLEKRVKVEATAFKSKGRNTPFDGWELVGAPVGTFLSGRRVVV
jgi:dihydroorotase